MNAPATDLAAKTDDITGIAKQLYFVPPPARVQFARDLYDLGCRFHPELATKHLQRSGPAWMGNHAPQRPVTLDETQAMGMLEKINPELAQRVKDARHDEAAKEQLRAELYDKVGPEAVEAMRDRAAKHVEDSQQ